MDDYKTRSGKFTKPELLAPAGGMEQLIAAVENGADAVYLGGKLFNARINADNFSDDDMREAVEYAHLRNVKIYVTLNTLISDEELQAALEYAASLYATGVDALIIQDLGLAYLIKKAMPDFPLHLSTQGTVYNIGGMRSAAKLGFDRVVLARELSLNEISKITQADICDVEVFVHGALCMCYSGQCQMSRILGGRSGNRGLCAQPCRLPYRDENGKVGYYLSPKDICTIDRLGELTEAGVKSLKIEGRMKSPKYVAIVTSIYRKYLDEYFKNGTYKVSDDDRKALEQIFNRGGFTEGYLTGNPGSKLLSGSLPKHGGVLIGKVVSIPGQKCLIDVELSDSLEIGDGVEMRSPGVREHLEINGLKLTGNVVTYIKPLKNNVLRIGDFKGKVKPGDQVYKITSKALIKEARSTYENRNRRKSDIVMEFFAEIGKLPILRIRECAVDLSAESDILFDGATIPIYRSAKDISVEGDAPASVAVTKALSPEAVEKQLRKTGGTPFEVRECRVDIDEGLSMPFSAVNKMRRDALEQLKQAKTKGRTPAVLKSVAEYLDPQILPDIFAIIDRAEKDNTEPDVRFSNTTKGAEDEYISRNFREIVAKAKNGILIENLGWICELTEAGAKVLGGAGLNVYNRAAAEAFEGLGVEIIEASPETKNGDIALMTTEYMIPQTELTDRKGKKYSIRRNKYGDKTSIFQKK